MGLKHPASTVLSPEDEDKALRAGFVALARQLYLKHKDRHEDRRKEAAANIEFAHGRYYSKWDRTVGRWSDQAPAAKNEPKTPKVFPNIFASVGTTAISRLLAARPEVSIRPGTSDPEEADAARAADPLINIYEWREQRMEDALAVVYPTLWYKDDVFFKVEFDPNAGEILDQSYVQEEDEDGNPIFDDQIVPSEPQAPQMDEDGNEIPSAPAPPTVKKVPRWKIDPETGDPIIIFLREGRNVLTVAQPEEVIEPPGIQNIRDAPWLLYVPRVPVSKLRADYPETFVAPDMGEEEGDADDDCCQVFELWVAPGVHPWGSNPSETRAFDKVWCATVANGHCLDYGPTEYDEIPWVHATYQRVPGQMRGRSPAHSVRLLQHIVNQLASGIAVSTALAAWPQILAAKGHKISKADLTATPGALIEYEDIPGKNPPQKLDGRSVASSAMGFFNIILQLMQTVSGQNEGGLMGGAATGDNAAIALRQMEEVDLAKLACVAIEVRAMLREWARLSLANWRNFAPLPRMVMAVGDNMAAESFSFYSGKAYRTFIIDVPPATVLPQSRATKFQEDLLKRDKGLISDFDFLSRNGDVKGEEMGLAHLDIDFARDEALQALTAKRVLTPEPVRKLLNNPALHCPQHMRDLLTPRFQKDPVAFQALFTHYMEHLDDQREAQQAQPAEAQAAQSGPQESEQPNDAAPAPAEPAAVS